MSDDDYTPRERGLLAGHTWARSAHHARNLEGVMGRVEPVAVAGGHITDELREGVMAAGVRERLDVSTEPMPKTPSGVASSAACAPTSWKSSEAYRPTERDGPAPQHRADAPWRITPRGYAVAPAGVSQDEAV